MYISLKNSWIGKCISIGSEYFVNLIIKSWDFITHPPLQNRQVHEDRIYTCTITQKQILWLPSFDGQPGESWEPGIMEC